MLFLHLIGMLMEGGLISLDSLSDSSLLYSLAQPSISPLLLAFPSHTLSLKRQLLSRVPHPSLPWFFCGSDSAQMWQAGFSPNTHLVWLTQRFRLFFQLVANLNIGRISLKAEISKGNEHRISKVYLHSHVHCSIIHNSQDMKIT